MPTVPLSIDKMVDWLAEEDKYWERTVSDPKLWATRKADTKKRQQRYLKKRLTLKGMVPRETNNATSSQPISISDMYDEDDLECCGIDTIKDEITTSFPTTSAEKGTSKRTGTVALEKICPKCNSRKANDKCSNNTCKSCCIKTTDYCKLTNHRRSKATARPGYSSSLVPPAPSQNIDSAIIAKIDEAIQYRKPVFVSYNAGTNSIAPRKITPIGWVAEKGGKFEVLCHLTEVPMSKTFYASKVLRIEDNDWGMPKGTLVAKI